MVRREQEKLTLGVNGQRITQSMKLRRNFWGGGRRTGRHEPNRGSDGCNAEKGSGVTWREPAYLLELNL